MSVGGVVQCSICETLIPQEEFSDHEGLCVECDEKKALETYGRDEGFDDDDELEIDDVPDHEVDDGVL